MKIYTLGDASKPVILLLPGTCCHWKMNFGHVFGELEKSFYIACVSYTGFDETAPGETFTSMTDECGKIEAEVKRLFGGRVFCAYGCSLGGSFVSLLIARRNIHIDHGIIGSSDMDQAGAFAAKLETAMIMPIFADLIRYGEFRNPVMRKLFGKKLGGDPDSYIGKFMKMMGFGSGMDFTFISKESMRNQFASDLTTPVGTAISAPGTVIHVFYAKKMGKKYLKRYRKYFAEPDIIEFDLQHEELLLDAPRWAEEVRRVCGMEG